MCRRIRLHVVLMLGYFFLKKKKSSDDETHHQRLPPADITRQREGASATCSIYWIKYNVARMPTALRSPVIRATLPQDPCNKKAIRVVAHTCKCRSLGAAGAAPRKRSLGAPAAEISLAKGAAWQVAMMLFGSLTAQAPMT